MIPLKPYLLRAIYDWALDNGFTPHILVDAAGPGVCVPPAFVRDGRITLNIHTNAVRGLDLTNDRISFSARFAGESFQVGVPIGAVLAIFARENGRGVFFQDEEGAEQEPPPKGGPTPERKPTLRIVK